MEEYVSAAEANRKFSSLLRKVREGQSYIVTSHGKPVARLVPAGSHEASKDRARAALFERLRRQPAIDIGPWSRDELYDE